MIGDVYVQSVISHVPRGLPQLDQIAMELRGHIAQRVENGQPLDDVLRQLGDPLTLAESYLSAVPLQSARLAPRLAAKLIDIAIVISITIAILLALWAVLPPEGVVLLPFVAALSGAFGYALYTMLAEYRSGCTIGKRLMGLHVVRESGARISLGQSIVRQIPFFGQFFFIDAAFALFTDRRQRAFEMLTKTRTITAAP